MMRKIPRGPRKRASSLVITMMVVTLLAIIIVAFMQAMSLARTSAKGYADIRQAQMAAEAGLDMAITQIIMAVGTNGAFVTGQTNYPNAQFPVVVIGRENLTNLSQMMPLVSGPTNLLAGFGGDNWADNFSSYASERTNQDPAVSVDINSDRKFIQQTADSNLYRASWVVLTNKIGSQTNYTRYAYLVIDEQARLNPVFANGLGGASTNATNWYYGPQDIALTNARALVLSGAQAALINASSNAYMYTDATLAQAFGDRKSFEAVKHLLTSQANPTFDMIPAWMPDGGKSKYNINDLATNVGYGTTPEARALNIAAIIGRNLTNFYRRDPALRATNQTTYVNRLAANIVDYIDSDGEFTRVNGEPSGQEVSVFPVAIAERVQALEGGATTSPHKETKVVTQFFVNAWNPSTKPVTINSAELKISNRYPYTLGTGFATPMPDYQKTINFSGLTVRPNEIVVLEFGNQEPLTVSSPTSTTDGPKTPATQDAAFIQYELKVNGDVVSRSQGADGSGENGEGGLEHDQLRVSGLVGTNNFWHISVTDHRGTRSGDPRFGSFAHTAWNGTSGSGAYLDQNWKGRRYQTGGSAYQDFTKLWQLRDNVPRNPSLGTKAANDSITPAQVASGYRAADANSAPGVIRDGPMLSIGELGHIFDPAHAEDDLTAPPVASSGWGSSGLAFNSIYQYGGGRTLRVGQKESQGAGVNNWDSDGERAMELLDLFTVTATNAVNGGAIGRINVNTAPVAVIAASIANIKLTTDPDLSGGGVRSIVTATNFANTVISNRPYSSLSALYKILPYFGSTNNYSPLLPTYTTNGVVYPDTLDRTREEAFGKWIQHVTIQSRCYRIYVLGQVLDDKKNPRSDVAIEARIFLAFEQSSQSFKPVIQYVRNIK